MVLGVAIWMMARYTVFWGAMCDQLYYGKISIAFVVVESFIFLVVLVLIEIWYEKGFFVYSHLGKYEKFKISRITDSEVNQVENYPLNKNSSSQKELTFRLYWNPFLVQY